MNKKPVNEVARIVVDLSDLLKAHPATMRHPFGAESRIFIAGDRKDCGGIAWTLIGEIEWDYHLVNLLCRERAVDAEFGRLLADGKRLPAEKYLALWRAAGAKRMPLLQLVAFGLTPVLEAVLPTTICKTREGSAGWYASPSLVSTDEDKSIWHIRLDNAEAFRLAADLRDVYWGQDLQDRGYGRTTRLDGSPQLPAMAPPLDLFEEAV